MSDFSSHKHKIATIKDFPKILHFDPPHMLYSFGRRQDILKFRFCLVISISYQISWIEIVITFRWKRTLTSYKKQYFKLIEIPENNQTTFFDPWTSLNFNDPISIGSWYLINLKILISVGKKEKIKLYDLLVYFKNGINSSSKWSKKLKFSLSEQHYIIWKDICCIFWNSVKI